MPADITNETNTKKKHPLRWFLIFFLVASVSALGGYATVYLRNRSLLVQTQVGQKTNWPSFYSNLSSASTETELSQLTIKFYLDKNGNNKIDENTPETYFPKSRLHIYPKGESRIINTLTSDNGEYVIQAPPKTKLTVTLHEAGPNSLVNLYNLYTNGNGFFSTNSFTTDPVTLDIDISDNKTMVIPLVKHIPSSVLVTEDQYAFELRDTKNDILVGKFRFKDGYKYYPNIDSSSLYYLHDAMLYKINLETFERESIGHLKSDPKAITGKYIHVINDNKFVYLSSSPTGYAYEIYDLSQDKVKWLRNNQQVLYSHSTDLTKIDSNQNGQLIFQARTNSTQNKVTGWFLAEKTTDTYNTARKVFSNEISHAEFLNDSQIIASCQSRGFCTVWEKSGMTSSPSLGLFSYDFKLNPRPEDENIVKESGDDDNLAPSIKKITNPSVDTVYKMDLSPNKDQVAYITGNKVKILKNLEPNSTTTSTSTKVEIVDGNYLSRIVWEQAGLIYFISNSCQQCEDKYKTILDRQGQKEVIFKSPYNAAMPVGYYEK